VKFTPRQKDILRETQRYQSRTLEDAWNETVHELLLTRLPKEVVDAMRTSFLIGATFVATHQKHNEALLEEALELLDV